MIKIIQDLKYGDHHRQSIDLFVPEGNNLPILFFVHGGAWSEGDRESYGHVGYFYAKRGYLTFIVDHRLFPEVKHPSHVEDVASALSWVKKNATSYGGDVDRIFLFGHSSGAHLVSLLVTNQKYLKNNDLTRSDVKGVISVSGIYQIGTNVSIAGYGKIFPTSKDRQDASVTNFIEPGMPPFLIMYAERDIITFSKQATNFHSLLMKCKVKSSTIFVEDENHVTILFDCVMQHKTGKLILEFLEKLKNG